MNSNKKGSNRNGVPKPCTILGLYFDSHTQRNKHFGLENRSLDIIEQRLARGWTEEQAVGVAAPPLRGREKLGNTKPTKTELLSLSSTKTIKEIAKIYSVHRVTVNKWKKFHGLVGAVKERSATKISTTLNNAIENGELEKLWQDGLTHVQIAKKLGTNHTTLLKYMRKNGVQRSLKLRAPNRGSTKYYVNEDFFENIDTEEKAYVLGFWAADGWMHVRALFIAVSEEDLEFLTMIKNIIPTDAPIVTKTKKSEFNRKRLSILSLARKKMYQDIQKLGYTDQKAENMVFPDIPKKLYKHFIRGFWDGDGYIGERQFSVVGKNQLFFRTLQNIIFEETGAKLNFGLLRGTYPRLTGAKKHKDAIRWIYSDSSIHLDRKYNKFCKYWKDTVDNVK